MKSLLLAAALAASQCNPPPAPLPEPEPPPSVEVDCSAACDRLRQLGCPEAAPTPEGASCEMVCDNAQDSPAPLPVACISRAQTCAVAARCE